MKAWDRARPGRTSEAVVQVYAARAFNWRRLCGSHLIAIKAPHARRFVVHQVLGWNAWRGLSVVDAREAVPDRRWYGADAELLLDRRGDDAEALIPLIEAAISLPLQPRIPPVARTVATFLLPLSARGS